MGKKKYVIDNNLPGVWTNPSVTSNYARAVMQTPGYKRNLLESNKEVYDFVKNNPDILKQDAILADQFEKMQKSFDEIAKIEAGLKAESKAKKYAAQSPVEAEAIQELDAKESKKVGKETTLGVDAMSYKDMKAERDKINEKTFAGKRKIIYDQNQERDQLKITEDDNFVTRNAKKVANLVSETINGISSFAYAGMWQAGEDGLTDQEQKRLNALNDSINKIEKPILEKQRKEIQAEYDAISKKYGFKQGAAFNWDSDEAALATEYEKALETYDDAIEGSGIWSGFWGARVGLVELPDTIKKTRLINKVKNEEQLSEQEQDLLNAYIISDKATKGGLNGNSNYELGQSLRQSVEFMAEAAVGQGLVRGMASKMLANSPRALGALETIGSTALMPSTYNQAGDKYSDSLQKIEDANGDTRFVASDKQKINQVNALKKALKGAEADYNIKKKQAEDIDAPEVQLAFHIAEQKRDRILNELDNLVDEKGNLISEESSVFDALAYGATQNIKENLAERYVGGIVDKFVPAVGSRLASSRIGSAIAKSRPARMMENINKGFGDALAKTDNILFDSNKIGKVTKGLYNNIGPNKMIHSLPAEMVEEIAVQMTPTYGEDYGTQLDELTSLDFYTQVAASTLLMGGSMASIGAGKHYYDMARNTAIKDKNGDYIKTKDKDGKARNLGYRDVYKAKEAKRADAKAIYRAIDKAVNDDQLAQDIGMATLGTVYQTADYQARIAELRDPEGPNPEGLTQEQRNVKADTMEKAAFHNLALQAVETGTANEFRRALRGLSKKKDVSEETKKFAKVGLDRLDKFEKIINKNKELINRGELTNLEVNKISLEETAKTLEEKLKETKTAFNNAIQNYNKGKEEGTVDADTMVQGLSENLEETDEQFNNAVANFLEAIGDSNPAVTQHLDYVKNLSDINNNLKEIDEKINYETNPANAEAIKQRVLDKFKNLKIEKVTPENVAEVKKELAEKGINDPKTASQVNAKVIEKTGSEVTQDKETPIVHDGFAKDEDIVNIINGEIDAQTAKRPATEKEKANQVTQNDLFDDDVELSPEEQAAMNNMKGEDFAPLPFNPNDDSHNNVVNNLADAFTRLGIKDKGMNFSSTIASLRSDLPANSVEQKFKFIAKAYEKATGNSILDSEYKKVYNENFFELGSEKANIANALNGGNVNPVSVANTSDNLTAQEIKETDTKTQPSETVYNPITNSEDSSIYAPHTERAYRGTGLKLGRVLGLEYVQEPGGKRTVKVVVNETAKPFMDWRNFQPGSEVTFVFDMDYLLDPNNILSTWDNITATNLTAEDDRPMRRPHNVREKLVDMFKNTELNSWEKIEEAIKDYQRTKSPDNPLFKNEEFLKLVPIGTINKGYTSDMQDDGTPASKILPGGLNDYYWFNNTNVALKLSEKDGRPLIAERERRIKENRRINLEARKQILAQGEMNTTVSERRDAANNVRILKTPEEYERGYTDSFYSLLSQFGNDLAEFQKNAAIGMLDTSLNFTGPVDNSGKTIPLTINKQKINKENVTNYEAFMKTVKESGFREGRMVFIHKSGVNSKGEDIYTIHNVITNHHSRQDQWAKDRALLDALYSKLAAQDNDYPAQKESKKKLRAEFKKQFGYDFTTGVKEFIENMYPTPLRAQQYEGEFRQDFNKKAQTPGRYDTIPDLSQYANVNEFLEALGRGDEIAKTNKTQMMLGNIHTNLVFTPITNNGQTIYTNDTQPVMSFDYDVTPQTPVQKEIQEDKKDRLEHRETFLKKAIEETTNEEEKKELEDTLSNVQQEIKKIEVKEENQTELDEDFPTTFVNENLSDILERFKITYTDEDGNIC